MNKENHSPAAHRARSPGPKVSKLLEMFNSGSPLPIDYDDERSADLEGFLARSPINSAAKKCREARDDGETTDQKLTEIKKNEESKPTLKPQSTSEKDMAPQSSSNEVRETKHGFFSESTNGVPEFVPSFPQRDLFRREEKESETSSSPRPTPALAYIQYVASQDSKEKSVTPRKFGANRFKEIQENLHNADEPIRPEHCISTTRTNETSGAKCLVRTDRLSNLKLPETTATTLSESTAESIDGDCSTDDSSVIDATTSEEPSDFQKMLLAQKQKLKITDSMKVKSESTAPDFKRAKISLDGQSSYAIATSPRNSDVGLVFEDEVELKRKSVAFDSSLDIKAATSDSGSNFDYETSDVGNSSVEFDASSLGRAINAVIEASRREPDQVSVSSCDDSASSTYGSWDRRCPENKSDVDSSIDRESVYSGDLQTTRERMSSTLRDDESEGSTTLVSEIDCSMITDVSQTDAEQAQACASVLMDDIIAQQTVVKQVSRALDFADQRNTTRGSSEIIEAERLLLIACVKQDILKKELAKLKAGNAFKGVQDSDEGACYGSITISNISLPLRRDELFKLHTVKESMHYLCLLRYKTQVIATQMVSTSLQKTSISFSNVISYRNVEPDFQIALEVYYYHCPTATDSKSKDKAKSGTARLGTLAASEKKRTFLSPFKKDSSHKHHTPTNPPAQTSYRSPTFLKSASIVLTRKNCAKSDHVLEQVYHEDAYANPLKGTISLAAELYPSFQMEYKGFLNMEDAGGKGIWHMRWCCLTKNRLCYWKYAENEQNRPPIGFIDLRQCEEVVEVSRTVCAIPNTFGLIARNEVTGNPHRQLIGCESKQLKAEWMANLRLVLLNLKTWSC